MKGKRGWERMFLVQKIKLRSSIKALKVLHDFWCWKRNVTMVFLHWFFSFKKSPIWFLIFCTKVAIVSISFFRPNKTENQNTTIDWSQGKLVHCDIVSKSSLPVLDILFDLDKAPNQPLKTESARERPSSSANVIIISTSNQVISLLTLMTSQSMARTQKSPKVKLIR